MWNMIVCDGDKPEREQLMELARRCLEKMEMEATVTGCAGWPELDGMAKQALPDAVIVAQSGVEGLNTITSARLLSRKIIWFSDLDLDVYKRQDLPRLRPHPRRGERPGGLPDLWTPAGLL